MTDVKTMKSVVSDSFEFKVPKGAAKRKKVLKEEKYEEEISDIIERDFFPDLKKLRAQTDYVQAVECNDAIKLKELHEKFGKPKPSTFKTPPPSAENESTKKKRLSLDQYLNSHTSQDNEHFQELLEASVKRHIKKYSYLYNEEMNDHLGSRFNPGEVNKEKFAKPEIIHSNTRLAASPFNASQSKEAINEVAKIRAKIFDYKIGVDGKEVLKSDASPKIEGFSFVRSPSPCPSILASPLMTWGKIEGTPFKLDGSDTPSSGPSFRMSDPTRREQLAIELAEKKWDWKRQKNTEKRQATPRASCCLRSTIMSPAAKQLATSLNSSLRSTSSPFLMSSSGRVATPNCSVSLATTSPASKLLATSKLGSKSPCLVVTSGKAATPNCFRTNCSDRSATMSPSRLDVGPSRSVGTSGKMATPALGVSTDDLLKINLPQRKRAQDFFFVLNN